MAVHGVINMNKIKLGYEIGTGEEVSISPSHLIVTGITQLSGKTTTLEALISRSGSRAIVFKTKPGEKSFTLGTEVAPFFRDRSDYEFVRSLIEAYAKEKLSIEKGSLMTLSKGSKDLEEIKIRVDETLAGGKLRGIKEEIYTRLQHYLSALIPQIKYANFSSVLNLVPGINIMNLERYTEEAQSLIIHSVAEEVLKNHNNIILVIPEAWKFIPQKYNNPCKRAVESFIRQGAANQNYIWIDSQDMAGVDKTPLKQISTWILGYQSERNEVKHTLDQISLPAKLKPGVEDIMKLFIGHFYLSSNDQVKKVYVQPAWLDDEAAIQISKGETPIPQGKKVEFDLKKLNTGLMSKANNLEMMGKNAAPADLMKLQDEINELRKDFFEKLQEFYETMLGFNNRLNEAQPEVNEELIVTKVLQKIKLPQIQPAAAAPQQIDVDSLIKQIIPKLPTGGSGAVYQVAPLEKIKKDFIEEIRLRIVEDIKSLTADEKKALRYIESKDADIAPNEFVTKCFMLAVGGSSSTKISNILKSLLNNQFIEQTPGKRYRKAVKKRIESLIGGHDASAEEIELLHNHILNELI